MSASYGGMKTDARPVGCAPLKQPHKPTKGGRGLIVTGADPSRGTRDISDSSAGRPHQAEEFARYRSRKLTLGLMLLAFGGSVFAIIQRGGAAEWFLASLLCALLAFSLLAPLLALQGLRAVRLGEPGELQAGSPMELRVAFTRALPIPFVWLLVREELCNQTSVYRRDNSCSSLAVAPLSRSWHVRCELNGLQRGRYESGGLTVTAGDWLGLAVYIKKLACPASFLVLPSLPEDKQAEAPRSKSDRGGAFLWKADTASEWDISAFDSPAAGRMSGPGSTLRPYQIGDSHRAIDWRMAAKGRGLHVKQLDQSDCPAVTLVIDRSPVASGQDERLFDACIGQAALAVKRAADGCRAVRLLAPGEPSELLSPAVILTEPDMAKLLRKLAVLRAAGAEPEAGVQGRRGANAVDGARTGALVPVASRLGNWSGLLAAAGGLSGGEIVIFTTDWRDRARWEALAVEAASRRLRFVLTIVTDVPTADSVMREQRERLALLGMGVAWVYGPHKENGSAPAADGGLADDRVQI